MRDGGEWAVGRSFGCGARIDAALDVGEAILGMKPLESGRGVPLNASGGRPDPSPFRVFSRGCGWENFASPQFPRERRRGRTRRRDCFGRRDCRRRCIGSSERSGFAGFQLGFVCFQGFAGRKSSPPSQPGAASSTLGALRRAAMSVRKRTASAIRGSRPRAVDDSARRNCGLRARRAAAGFMGEHGHGFSSSEVERRE